MRTTCQAVLLVAALVVASSSAQASGLSIAFFDGTNETTLAVCDPSLECERPRLNNHGEVVWTQRVEVDTLTFGIYSNLRGLIASGYVIRDPDINDVGEIIWRFGDGAGRRPNGIESSIRGVVYLASGQDPYYDTQRINNLGEIVATRGPSGQVVWSNVQGNLPAVGFFAVETEINDSGEIVYRSQQLPSLRYSIQSTVRGEIVSPDSAFVQMPDINNLGEIVWVQTAPGGQEVWSNLRGKVGKGLDPSINDSGEIVWTGWDGHDNEIYSSLRGQITFNDVDDVSPQINNRGDIAWLRREAISIPEPVSATLAIWGFIGLVALAPRRRPC